MHVTYHYIYWVPCLTQVWLRSEHRLLKMDASVQVLTSGFWPVTASDTAQVILPRTMTETISTFLEFYGTRTANRVLKYVRLRHHLSLNAELCNFTEF